ncbi:hypothetical protein Tcan_11576 [Toxocara canis]|uniref:Uncharacterized protein n=1 Tax=Toxocara canis TaxID=6265 RepID=A0A0B2VYW1_TOXCA|nr:hypothetical protein Tcan_11576 [Toxocara canis]
MSEEHPTQDSSRADSAAHAPVWSVTRRQRTELSPLRDNESGTQSYRSRTITTTERVQVVQTPLEADGTDFPIEVLSSTGRSERLIESATTRHEADAVPVVGGVSADGVPLYSGIFLSSESSETTTIITTTTTTYRVFEVESDESAGEENGKETELTINFPLECESAKHAKTNGEVPDGEPFYVVIGKKDTPSPTSETPGHVVKTLDIDLSPTEPVAHDSHARQPCLEDDERHPTPFEFYDAHDGSVASTSKAYEINGEPIEKYVSVYHNGRSDGLSEQDERQITDEITTMLAKLSGSYKRAAVHGEHTIYLPVKGRRSHDHRSQYDHDPIGGGRLSKVQREMRSTYSVKFSDPFKIEQDIDERVASTSKAKEIPEEDIEKYVSVYHSGWSDRTSKPRKRQILKQKETGIAVEEETGRHEVVCIEEGDHKEHYELQRLKGYLDQEAFRDTYEKQRQFKGGTTEDITTRRQPEEFPREEKKPTEELKTTPTLEGVQEPYESVSAEVELEEAPQVSVTTITITDERSSRVARTRDIDQMQNINVDQIITDAARTMQQQH